MLPGGNLKTHNTSLVRFVHNWNTGIVECWNTGFWEIEEMGCWENQLDKPYNKLKSVT